MRRVTDTNLLFWVKLTYQSSKCKTSVYVLTEICLQWSKWLGPYRMVLHLYIWHPSMDISKVSSVLSKMAQSLILKTIREKHLIYWQPGKKCKQTTDDFCLLFPKMFTKFNPKISDFTKFLKIFIFIIPDLITMMLRISWQKLKKERRKRKYPKNHLATKLPVSYVQNRGMDFSFYCHVDILHFVKLVVSI